MNSFDPSKLAIYPVLGHSFTDEDFLKIDLSVNNDAIRGLDVVEGLDTYIKVKLKQFGKKVAKGGYGEERDFYWSSPLFKNEAEKRTIHLGIDLWTNPMQEIYAPIDGVVHSLKNNNQALDYGYTILLKHSVDGFTFYSLYGHLSDKSFRDLEVGQQIKAGDRIAYVGYPETNGGWAPHLHLQLILDIADNFGDYPGVCTKASQSFYLNNCPNPEFLIFKK